MASPGTIPREHGQGWRPVGPRRKCRRKGEKLGGGWKSASQVAGFPARAVGLGFRGLGKIVYKMCVFPHKKRATAFINFLGSGVGHHPKGAGIAI